MQQNKSSCFQCLNICYGSFKWKVLSTSGLMFVFPGTCSNSWKMYFHFDITARYNTYKCRKSDWATVQQNTLRTVPALTTAMMISLLIYFRFIVLQSIIYSNESYLSSGISLKRLYTLLNDLDIYVTFPTGAIYKLKVSDYCKFFCLASDITAWMFSSNKALKGLPISFYFFKSWLPPAILSTVKLEKLIL